MTAASDGARDGGDASHPLLRSLRSSFPVRVGARRPWAWLAYGAPRGRLAVALALAPVLAYLALLPAMPTLDDEQRVTQVFSRSISGLITTATIAVGFGTLALRRGIKGIGELTQHVEADDRFRADTRRITGRDDLPLQVGDFLGSLHEDLARLAREAREALSPSERERPGHGVALRDCLAALEERAEDTRRALRAAEASPPRTLAAALDFDHDVARHLVRAYARDDGLSQATRGRLDRLEAVLGTVAIATSYVKTLDTQWGLSHMAHGIALTSFAAIFVSAFLALGYRDGASPAWVAAGLFALALPLAVFVSYAIRFVFVHEHSLPIGAFTLGPESRVARR